MASQAEQMDLTELERRVLVAGCFEWGGPARCTPAMALAMGCHDPNDVVQTGKRLGRSLAAGNALDLQDLHQALLLTEIVFINDRLGSGVDWENTTGLLDGETISALRGLQRKILHS